MKTNGSAPSLLAPTFVNELSSPDCRSVLLCGCGGGFDFVHAMLLYPELVRLGKRVTIASNSFGRTESIGDPAPIVFRSGDAVVKLVSGSSAPDPVYAPEIHLCAYLDVALPARAPHEIYASNARDFTVATLRAFYGELVRKHAIDTVITIDGGTDSLVAGDEASIGDPIEDATSIAAIADLPVDRAWLLTIGFGMDRYNGVTDASSMRAVAEITQAGGSLGAISIEPASAAFDFYRDAVSSIYERQSFRSAATGFILAAIEGHYGGDTVPESLARKLREGDPFFIWPLMATLFAFDLRTVAKRSLIASWIRDAESEVDASARISAARKALGEAMRAPEELPRSDELAGQYGVDFTTLTVVDRATGDAMLEELAGADEPDSSAPEATGLSLARGLYHDTVAPILRASFPDFRYDAALIGPGSEVLGYDDETSRDHHWGPRVQIFCSGEDAVRYTDPVRETLERELPYEYEGFPVNFSQPGPADHGVQHLQPIESGPVNHRVEVIGLDAWLRGSIGVQTLDPLDWLTIPQQKLLTIVSGEVFHEGWGDLVRARESLRWYPDDVWRYQLAAAWARIGQEEHLVGRAGSHGDEIGARITASRLARDAMRLSFLMERRYAPYPKWFGRAFAELDAAPRLQPLLAAVLSAADWRARDAALVPVYEELVRAHNRLAITQPLPDSARLFFGRPFHVIALHGFAARILDTIDSAWLTPVMRRSPIGAIDQFTDNTDLLEDPAYRASVREMIAAPA